MKKIIILFVSLFLVGCSANYTLTIDNDSYIENVQIIPGNDDEKNTLFSNEWKIPIDYDIYSATDDSDNSSEVEKEHYEYKENDDSIEFEYAFSYNSIINSTALKYCFNSARIINRDNNIIITTNKESNCFGSEGLDELVINIIVKDKNVISNNADKIIGNKYIWNINKNNYKDKSINLTLGEMSRSTSSSNLDKEKGNFFSNIYIDNSMLIFCFIFFIVVGVVVLIYKKIQKDDE